MEKILPHTPLIAFFCHRLLETTRRVGLRRRLREDLGLLFLGLIPAMRLPVSRQVKSQSRKPSGDTWLLATKRFIDMFIELRHGVSLL